MPKLSEIDGIQISMRYFEHNERHHSPHFHVKYAEYSATIACEPVEVFESNLPPSIESRVLKWARTKQLELLENWELLKFGKKHKKIDP